MRQVSDGDVMIICRKDGDEYVATCPEFPSLSWVDENEYDAIQGLQSLIDEVREEMRSSNS